jgi:hypothetical protein
MSYSCAVYTLWCPILSLIATMETELSVCYSCAVYTLMVSHTQFDCHHGDRTQCATVVLFTH